MPMYFTPGFHHWESKIAAVFGAEDGRAIEVPLSDPRLAEIVMFGNGKDADLALRLADGAVLEMGMGSLTIACASAVESTVRSHDDYNVVVRYSGTGLRISSLRVAFNLASGSDYFEPFDRDVQEWIDNSFVRALNYAVHVHITLVAVEG